MTAESSTLAELLIDVVPTAVRSLRLDVGLSLELTREPDTNLSVVRTVRMMVERESPTRRRTWHQVGPVIVDDSWGSALTALGVTLDELYASRVNELAATEHEAEDEHDDEDAGGDGGAGGEVL